MNRLTDFFLNGAGDAPLRVVGWELLYVLVLFFILVAVLQHFMYKPILAVLAERNDRLDGARDRRDVLSRDIDAKSREQVERLTEAKREALAKLEQAKAVGAEERQAKVAAARGRATETLDAAAERISGVASRVEAELRKGADDLAKTIASAVLGREVA